MKVLETDRLILRRISTDDAEFMLELSYTRRSLCCVIFGQGFSPARRNGIDIQPLRTSSGNKHCKQSQWRYRYSPRLHHHEADRMRSAFCVGGEIKGVEPLSQTYNNTGLADVFHFQ